MFYTGGFYYDRTEKNLKKYIIPAMIGNLSFFILTIVDGMFVGNGVGVDAFGAVSIAMPFVNLIWALSTLFNIGGVTVASVRFGRGDAKGANRAFMHALSANIVVFFDNQRDRNADEQKNCASSRCKRNIFTNGFRLCILVLCIFSFFHTRSLS